MEIYDLIVIGSGAAGATASIYATRFNLKTLMLGGPMPGGLITEASDVENYPGYVSISGMQLADNFVKQAVTLGAEYKIELADTIKSIPSGKGSLFEVSSGGSTYKSRSIILAMGTHHRKLDVPGEYELSGRGVSYCATCDAPFYKQKIVAVVGGGNSAVEAAQDLSVHASKVYLIYRSDLKAAPVYIDQLRSKNNVIEISDANILEIKGGNKVESVKLDVKYQGSDVVNVGGVFIQIGYIPKNELAKSLGLNITQYGYVEVDAGMGTNLPGVFCAGDLNNSSNMLHQQVTSAAEGAIAAQSVYRYLNGIEYIVRG